MTNPHDPEALLAAYLDEGMTVLPDRVITSILDEAHRSPQRRVVRPWTQSTFRAVISAAAAIALLVVGGALLYQRGMVDVSGPSPTAEASASPTEPAVIPATPTPTAEILSLDLTWTEVDLEAAPGKVAWLGDRFVLVDSAGAIRTSTDGLTWDTLQPGDADPGYADLLWDYTSLATWEDDIVGWWNPEDGRGNIAGAPPITARDIVRVIRPPAPAIDSTPFEGRIESLGVGPLGIVAHVHSRLNYATEDNWDSWVTKKLGLRTNNDWTCCVKEVTFEGGVLDIKLTNGPGLHVVWADEGFLPGDYQDRGFGWYSPDGVAWTPIPSDIPPAQDRGDLPAFPTGMGEVVGVSDGFIARGVTPEETCTLPDGCSEMWHSADGLTWRNLGHPSPDQDFFSGRLLPWQGGAILTDGIGRFDFWTSDGVETLPLAAELPAHPQEDEVVLGTGPFGLVSLRLDRMEMLVTRDGVDWELHELPSEMDTATDYGGPTIAVGERSVLYLAWSGYLGEGPRVPHLWVGSAVP